MKIVVVGLGYIGLPTATMFASKGVSVLGVDIDREVVDTVNRGEVHIVEPELDGLVQHAVSRGTLTASTVPQEADAFFIAVPTPLSADGNPDMGYVEAAALSLAPFLRPGNLVVLESTSPVGTTQKLCSWLAEARPDIRFPDGESTQDAFDVRVAYCPERVLPGRTVQELVENDRIIGGVTPACSESAEKVYRLFVRGEILFTNARTAEMCKLAENSFRDVGIAFANELSLICDQHGVDVWELIGLANRHPRVDILRPGVGVGGHCIAIDPWFLIHSARGHALLTRTARDVNDRKRAWVVEKIERSARQRDEIGLGGDAVVLYGLSFKPDIDDLRESPALQIARDLRARIASRILVVEPHLSRLPDSLVGMELIPLDDAVRVAGLHAVLVAHSAFLASRELRDVVSLDFVGLRSTVGRRS